MDSGHPEMIYHAGWLLDDNNAAGYSAMLNALPGIAFIVDDRWQVALHSQSAAPLLKIQESDVYTGPFADLLSAESKKTLTALTDIDSGLQISLLFKAAGRGTAKAYRARISSLPLNRHQYYLLLLEEAEHPDAADRKLLQQVLANVPGTAMYVIDTNYKYLLAEGDWKALPVLKNKLEGKYVYDVLEKEALNIILPVTEKIFSQANTIVNKELSWKGLHFLLRATALFDDEQRINAALITVVDVSQIKDVQLQISKLNDSLERKVLQRTEELSNANNELEAFSYSVSHDLRTPLRAMSGYAQMVKEMYENALDDNGKRLLNNIVLNAGNMGRLIDDLLAFSRLSRKDIAHQQVNMINLVKECVDELLPAGSKVKIDVAYLPVSSADPAMIKQVWLNLIGNSIKYSSTKEQPIISIGSKKLPQEYVFFVKDNGVGFDMKYADKLFGVFQRLHGQTDFEGTGIGLALVKRIVEKHNGRVWAESTEGEGATFYFSLPQLF